MSLEQNEPRSVKTPVAWRRRRIVIAVLAFLALPLVTILLSWYGCPGQHNEMKPPAPNASEAEAWRPETQRPETQRLETHDRSQHEAKQPTLVDAPTVEPAQVWVLPLEIVFDDIPEIPEEIKGPSPPIEEDGRVDDR